VIQTVYIEKLCAIKKNTREKTIFYSVKSLKVYTYYVTTSLEFIM